MVEPENKNLILIDGNIFTMDTDHPMARWVIIHGNGICAFGEGNEWRNFRKAKDEIIDCKENTVLPGFIDAHLHLYSFAENLVTPDLSRDNGIHSVEDLQNILQRYSECVPSGFWIRGKGYDEFYLRERRHPDRRDLDKAVPDNPVKITHRSSHAHVLNSMALKMVGISRETPDPPRGIIDRDLSTAEPTGLLYEMGDFLSHHIPPLSREELEKGVLLANKRLISKGITSFQDASAHNDVRQWELFKGWKGSSILKPRVGFIIGTEAFSQRGTGPFDTELSEDQLRVNGVKIILDETTGCLLPSDTELDRIISDIHNSGLQAIIHAIEENAVEAACGAIERILKTFPRRDHRHRIEHCSVCPPNLARRLSLNNIMVTTHPEFIFHSGDRYLKTVPGKNLKYLYALNTLINNGVTVAAGSDCPVVHPDPVIGNYCAISRMSKNGNVVNLDESISLHEALKLYTVNAAKSSFEENIKGSLIPGKLADLIILNGDISRMRTDELKFVEVDKTIINGELVWSR
ncbi:MAG: amidohydrolase [Deltaproteobacteria bacterium]|nr:amidohydrolase [Deltaproteobacteria bacterium]